MYLNKEPLCGNIKSKFILISDSNMHWGLNVFKTVINTFCKEKPNLCFLCFDSVGTNVLHGLNVNDLQFEFVNAFSDPLGWNQENKSWSLKELYEKYLNFKGVLCIYSLTSLVIRNGADKVYILLHKLLNFNPDVQIVGLLHADVHDPRDNEIFESLATTSLGMNSSNDPNNLLCTIHYSSGKVKSLLLDFKISANFEFISLTDSNLFVKREPVKQPDPTANLTFNLKLKDNEKVVKDQLQLPYMKMQNPDEAIIQNLLENDFYDEEDPDDDLDI